uniref:Sin3 histone deacetylase corepressor complex component SDS3-like n=1 Tax=Hirondellea gigas TaxID=1518452 RepID=A0A2P2I0Z9_9CRUS
MARYASSSDIEDMDEEMDISCRTPQANNNNYTDSDDSDLGNRKEEFSGLKDQVYYDKLKVLKKQLQQVKDRTHPDYRKKIKKIDQTNKERLRMNDLWKEMEMEKVEKEFVLETRLAEQELQDKKEELKENLLLELEEKKKVIEQERYSLDLNGDSMEYKTVNTRKLRRRGAEPTPTVEKRRKQVTTTLQVLLDDKEIEDDLRVINKAKITQNSNKYKVNSVPVPQTHDTHSNEPRIENSKLYFDKKWFHKGQSVMVECKDGSRFNAVLTCAENNMINVRKVCDNSRLKITLAQLAHGKYLVRRGNTNLSMTGH